MRWVWLLVLLSCAPDEPAASPAKKEDDWEPVPVLRASAAPTARTRDERSDRLDREQKEAQEENDRKRKEAATKRSAQMDDCATDAEERKAGREKRMAEAKKRFEEQKKTFRYAGPDSLRFAPMLDDSKVKTDRDHLCEGFDSP